MTISIGGLNSSAGIGRLTGLTTPTPSKLEQAGAEFANILKDGESAAVSGMLGEMPVQQAVEKVLEAERTAHMAFAVRDKLVAAYLEISRMQI